MPSTASTTLETPTPTAKAPKAPKTRTPKANKAPNASQPSTVHVLFVIDSSGSMASRATDVRGGFNEYVTKLKEDTATDYRLTAVTFDTTVKTLFTATSLVDVPELTTKNYCPGGGTALYDALGVSLDELTTAIRKPKKVYGTDRALVIVMTDGEENSSTRFGKDAVIGKMKRREAAGNWTFVYLGADQDAWAAAQGLGFAAGNVAGYAGAQTRQVWNNLATSTATYSVTTVNTGSSTSFATSLNNTTGSGQNGSSNP